MSKKFSIELDTDFLEGFYGLLNEPAPEVQKANVEDFKRIISRVKPLLPTMEKKDDGFGGLTADEDRKKVLIVDDLGVITYQLSVMLGKQGYDSVSSQEIYDAIAKYKKQYFDIVIIDLFIPTEREGFLLLDEIVKMNKANGNKSIIGIMTASNKKEHKMVCKEKGAQFYVEKVDDWQKNLAEMCHNLCRA